MTQREETANKTIQTRAFSLLSLIAPHSSCCDFISLLCAFSCAFLTHSHPLTDSSSPSCSFNPNPTAIMNGEGEKTCPLCAEDMDLTDQQLKPCTCGYEICVWCWHHLMDMAEKDDTDGRCPACRVPYDKAKIVGMAAKCERLVAEMSMEKKGKSQKAKAKSSDGRKQLCSVRVIQRNLVYIIGLPLNLADEDLLQHREYFGQYGKVLKVSMSRTATGVIQQFPNNTCSVYITYAKEEEAIRCIENAHGFLLDGRSLRACFGTTKYCHAWLRNVPCTNSDCLYLHEIGTQEDSFTKDEIVSAYTRSRVQQITGAANNVQRRSGNVLPPPIDDYCVNGSASSGKQSKMSLTSTGCIARDSHPKGSSGRSVALPATAAWGMCGANGQKLTVNTFSNGPSKQKPDTTHCMFAFSCTTQASTLDGDGGNKQPAIEDNHPVHAKVKPESLNNVKLRIISDHQVDLSETAIAVDGAGASNLSNQFSDPQELKENDTFISLQPSVLKTAEQHGQSSSSHCKKEQNAVKGWVQNLCLEVSSVSMISDAIDNNVGISRLKNSSDNSYVKSSPQGQGLPEFIAEQYREPSAVAQNKSIDGVYVSRDQNDRMSDVPPKELIEKSSEFEDVISFDNQRLKDPEVVTHSSYLPNSINGLHSLSQSRLPMKPHEADGVNINSDNLFVDNKVRDSSILCMSNVSMTSNGYPENFMRSSVGSCRTSEQHSFLHPTEGTVKQMGRLLGDAGNVEIGFVDKGESSIISNILSMDFDTWGEDEPLTSPQNLAKLLGDGEKLSRAQKLSSSWKGQTNNQSRFSFARQEESINQTLKLPQSQNTIGPLLKTHSSSHDVAENKDSYFDKVGIRNGFSTSNFEDLESCASNQLPFSSNKLSVSRAQISAPPGFSVPNRAPPPGFSSHERVDQAFDSLSGKSMLDSSSLLRDAYQPKGNIADIELMDPAILAVGKERFQGGLNNPALEIRSSFPSQLSPFENDARLQLLMQRSISSQQSLRFPDIGDNFSHFNESYGISSRLVDHSQANNLSHFVQMSLQQPRNGLMSNGHWNEVQGGNTVSMTELPRNERLGFNKSHDCYGGSKFWRSTSGDLYSRTFGI